MKVKIPKKFSSQNPECVDNDIEYLRKNLSCFSCPLQDECLLDAIKTNNNSYRAGIYIGNEQIMIQTNIEKAGGINNLTIEDSSSIIEYLKENPMMIQKHNGDNINPLYNSVVLPESKSESDDTQLNLYSKKEVLKIKLRLLIEERILIFKNIFQNLLNK